MFIHDHRKDLASKSCSQSNSSNLSPSCGIRAHSKISGKGKNLVSASSQQLNFFLAWSRNDFSKVRVILTLCDTMYCCFLCGRRVWKMLSLKLTHQVKKSLFSWWKNSKWIILYLLSSLKKTSTWLNLHSQTSYVGTLLHLWCSVIRLLLPVLIASVSMPSCRPTLKGAGEVVIIPTNVSGSVAACKILVANLSG